MNTTVEDLIKEVAVKHNIALGPDDPLLILHTIHQHLINDFNQNLVMNLDAFRAELESILKQEQGGGRADRIFSHTINLDQTAVAQGIRQALRAEITSQITPTVKQAERLSQFALIAAGASLLASAAVLWAMFHR